jgi:hypothetical protein
MQIRVPGYTTSNSGQDLLDEILINRRIELWGEGFRWFDLKRMNLPLVRSTEQGHLSSVCNGPLTINKGPIEPTDNLWVYQFPRRELTANPLLVQNP